MLLFPLENGVWNGASKNSLLQPIGKECFISDRHVSARYPGTDSSAA